jgi:hypothetical protein
VRMPCVLVLCFAPLIASADGMTTEYTTPEPIDLASKRVEMSDKFPQVGDETPRIRALIKYKREHERFRIGVLEGLNEQIKKICEDLKAIERKIRRDLKNGILSQNAYDDVMYRIEEERKNCLFDNRAISQYFKLYDEFKELYQISSAEADVLIAECYASDTCSGRP